MTTVKDIQICINVHFDAVSLWIGSFGGADSPCDISRGVFAAKRGVPRLLDMFRRYGIVTTWHITGHSMESFPRHGNDLSRTVTRSGFTDMRTKIRSLCRDNRKPMFWTGASNWQTR